MITFNQFCEAKARLDPEGHELYGKPPSPPQGRRNAKLVGAEDHELYGKEAPPVAATPQDVQQSIQSPAQDYKQRLLMVADRQIEINKRKVQEATQRNDPAHYKLMLVALHGATIFRKLAAEAPEDGSLQRAFDHFNGLLRQTALQNERTTLGLEYISQFLRQIPADLMAKK